MTTQQAAALEVANERRMGGAVVRREVRSGVLSLEEALRDPRAGHLGVERVLGAQRGWGEQRTMTALRAADVRWGKKCRDLTDRQVGVLAEVVGGV